MRRWGLTLLITASLWAGYRGYSRLIGPWTRPGPGELLSIPRLAPVEIPANPPDFAAADQKLQSTSWTPNAKYKIKHGDSAYIYFDRYETVDERVELSPFAMVLSSTKDPQEAPYVVHCSGAHLSFERPFKLGGASPGRILTAALDGVFKITGPNGLLIHGRDCRFAEDSHQLYSDQPIAFSYAPDEGSLKQLRGRADKLQIDFEPTTYAAHGRDMPRVGDVETVTLRREVDLEFDVVQEGEVVTSRVTCRGPFVFDFPRQLATFQDQAHVARPTKHSDGTAGYDELKAEWLALKFEDPQQRPSVAPPADGQPPAAEAAAESASPLGKLDLQMVRAIGKSRSAPVVVTSTAAHLTGTMHDLLYDAVQRTLVLQDPEDTVRLKNDEVLLQTPLLRVNHDAAGELTSVVAERAGRLDYQRPGAPGEPPQQFHALWNNLMTLTPDPEQKLIFVTLEGDARVIQPSPENQMGLLCDRLTLEVDSERFDKAGFTGDAQSKPTDGKTPGELPLRHALAVGDVAMDGAQFSLTTDRLDVTFQAGRLPKGQTGKPQPAAVGHRTRTLPQSTNGGQRFLGVSPQALPSLRNISRRPSTTARQSPVFQVSRSRHASGLIATAYTPVPRPAPHNQTVLGSIPPEVVPRVEDFAAAGPVSAMSLGGGDHWTVKAASIEALILQDPDTQQSELREVVGVKHVDIKQSIRRASPLAAPVEKPAEPLSIAGHRLHLVNSGGLDQVLHLNGTPAKLDRGAVHIEGDELYFDRELNTARVIGKGMMKSPVQGTISGEAGPTPSDLTIYWLREMNFDGTIATFIEGVSTRIDDSVMRCDEMNVTLNRHVDFSSEHPDTQGLTIQNVLCQRGVEFQYIQWDPESKSEALARAEGKAAEFELRYDTGDFEARGGGRLEVWQRNEDSRVEVAPQTTAASNRPISASKLPWQYTEVIFHDRVDGNLHRKLATIFDRVWVMYAPVDRALQRFTRDDLSHNTESAKNAVWMGSDELTISLHPRLDEEGDYVQIQALGKLKPVELEGRLFQATSDILTYDESTKLFTLRGQAGHLVSVAMQDRPGGQYSESTKEMIQFNPAQKTVSFQGSRGAFGSR